MNLSALSNVDECSHGRVPGRDRILRDRTCGAAGSARADAPDGFVWPAAIYFRVFASINRPHRLDRHRGTPRSLLAAMESRAVAGGRTYNHHAPRSLAPLDRPHRAQSDVHICVCDGS